jgi:tetratricopeptide (TPR) repeat protein
MKFEDTTFGSYDKAERRARKAHELYENGNVSQALLVLEEAIQINPSNGTWHFNKALGLDTINRFEEAIAEYEIALQLAPDDLEILNSLAVDYTRTGQYDRAIETFEYIHELDSTFEPCYCNRIITYTEMDQHDLAEQMFYLAQQLNPNCALCYYNIGNNLFVRGLYKKAIHCWQRTVQLEPTHPQINYRIAQAYWSDGDCPKAHEYFLAELRANPGDIDVILDFGLFLLQTGDLESAKEKFNRILELDPGFASALFYLGEIAFNNNDYEKATEFFRQALQKDDSLTGPHYRLAQCELMKGHNDNAKNHLICELELAPEDGAPLVSMGSMFLTIGEFDLATDCLVKAATLDCGPKSAHADSGDTLSAKYNNDQQQPSITADAYYYLGLVCIAKDRLEDAAEFFGHALDIRPQHILALRDSAAVYLAMGKINDAAQRIKKVTALTDKDQRIKSLDRKIRLSQSMEQVTDFLSRFIPR